MHYFFLEDEALAAGTETALAGEDVNHAHRVLRLKAGDEIVLSDGLGRAWQGRVTFSSPGKVLACLERELPSSESPLKITLFQSLVKGEKMDLIVRQAVELGAYRIVPVITGRSIPQRDRNRDERRVSRWRKIIRSAAAQCRRPFLAGIEAPVEFRSALTCLEGIKVLVPWEREKSTPLGRLLKQPCPGNKAVFLFIGPEGGFEPAEIKALTGSGAETVHMGPRILRSETAAAAVISLVQGAWGDLAGEGDCR